MVEYRTRGGVIASLNRVDVIMYGEGLSLGGVVVL